MTKLIVFSICKDEEPTIGEVLDRIPTSIDGIDVIERIVVSDGSTDDTARVAREHGADLVIEGRSQRRLAFRFQQAVEIVLERGADVAVGIDGDLQFDPSDIPSFVAPIVSGEADFVAADRFTDASGRRRRPENMPRGKYIGNCMGASIVGSLSGENFPDVTCGFRAYNRRALLTLNLNSKYTYTQESFQLIAYNQLEIRSIPVEVTYYPGRKSRVVTSFVSFVLVSGINILRAARDFAPLRFFTWLSLPPLVIGFVSAGFVGIHWLRTSQTSPYTSLGIVGAYLFSLGLLLLVFGLVGDMLGRSTRNQEKIIRELKVARHGLTPRELVAPVRVDSVSDPDGSVSHPQAESEPLVLHSTEPVQRSTPGS